MFACVFVSVITTAYKCPCLAVFTGSGCVAGTRKRETLLTLRRGAATPYQAERSSSPMDEKKQSKRTPNRPYLCLCFVARFPAFKISSSKFCHLHRLQIHDTTYGGSSDEEDFFSVYHQSAAANALLYVGLGTTAIGSVIFFVGTGEKGFKTLELRLIGNKLLMPIHKYTVIFFLGPTLIACGLLCCLIRVLLCACPSTCFRKRKKTRLKSGCPHTSSKYPLAPQRRDRSDFVALDKANLLTKQQHKKKVCIAPPTHPIPSTSTMDFQEHTAVVVEEEEEDKKEKGG